MSRETEQFFLQAEDGIRDGHVTGVQTCALPILNTATHPVYRDPGPTGPVFGPERVGAGRVDAYAAEIGRASCRERVSIAGAAASRMTTIDTIRPKAIPLVYFGRKRTNTNIPYDA